MNQRIANLHARLARLERKADRWIPSSSDRRNSEISNEMKTLIGEIESQLKYYAKVGGRYYAGEIRSLKKALDGLKSASAEVSSALADAEYIIIGD